jgi:LemA protein
MSDVGIWLLTTAAVLSTMAAIRLFNRLIQTANQCANAWASAEVNLKKRHDLIPNVVQAVKGYTNHEGRLLERVTELRRLAREADALPQQKHNEADLGNVLAQLIGRVEAYPELKTDEQYIRLQATLTEIEEQISASRRAYNAAVLEYNNLVEQFPSRVIASATGFRAKSFFSADPVSRRAPTMELQCREEL